MKNIKFQAKYKQMSIVDKIFSLFCKKQPVELDEFLENEEWTMLRESDVNEYIEEKIRSVLDIQSNIPSIVVTEVPTERIEKDEPSDPAIASVVRSIVNDTQSMLNLISDDNEDDGNSTISDNDNIYDDYGGYQTFIDYIDYQEWKDSRLKNDYEDYGDYGDYGDFIAKDYVKPSVPESNLDRRDPYDMSHIDFMENSRCKCSKNRCRFHAPSYRKMCVRRE